jgi:zinc protease
VLRQESANDPGDIVSQLMAHRFGHRGFGGADVQELGLRWLGAEEVAAWRASRFTAGNAVLWFHGPQPPDATLGLTPGERMPPPAPEPLPGLEFPASVSRGTGGVAIGALGERSWGTTATLALARERLHERLRLREGLVYEVWADYQTLAPELAHIALGTGCADEEAGRVADTLVATLEELRDSGPDADELAALKRRIERGQEEDPDPERSELDRAAREELLGAERRSLEEQLEDLRALGPREMSEAAEAALAGLVIRVPEGVDSPRPDFAPLDRESPSVDAPVFRRKALLQGTSELAIGDAGVRYSDGGETVAIPAGEVAAVIEGSGGDFVVLGVDGSWVEIDPGGLREQEAAIEAIRALSPTPVVPSDDDRAGLVKRVASEQLKSQWALKEELALLPGVLRHRERPVAMAEARRTMKVGLLVLTDQRLLFLFAGLRKEEFLQFERGDIERAAAKRSLLDRVLRVSSGGEEFDFADLKPKERLGEVVAALDGRG